MVEKDSPPVTPLALRDENASEGSSSVDLESLERKNEIPVEEAVRLEVNTRIMHLEYFNWPVLDFVDEVIDAVNRSVHDVVRSLEARLTGLLSPAGYDANGNIAFEPVPELQQVLFSLESLLVSNVDREWETFELYVLRVIFGVEEDLNIPLASEPKDQEVFFGDESELVALEEKIEQQRAKITALQLLQQRIRSHTNMVQQRLVRLRKSLEFLDALGDIEPFSPLVFDKIDRLFTLVRDGHPVPESMLPNEDMQRRNVHWEWVIQETLRVLTEADVEFSGNQNAEGSINTSGGAASSVQAHVLREFRNDLLVYGSMPSKAPRL